MLNLTISRDDVAPIIQQFAATEKQVNRAAVRALKKVAGNIGVQVKKDVAQAAQIPQKALGNRVYAEPVQGEPVLRIWFGAYSVPISALGEPKEGKAAVRVGKRRFARAFVATMLSGHRAVFMRYSSRYWTPEIYRGKGGGPNVHAGRLPIYEPRPVPIADEMERSIARRGAAAFELFQRRFAEELNYEVNVRGLR